MISLGYIAESVIPHTPIVEMTCPHKLAIGKAVPQTKGLVVVNQATGRTWVLTWDELIQLAVEAGINQPQDKNHE